MSVKFTDYRGRFAVWVQHPEPNSHIVDTPCEVIEFLLHEDGCNLQIPYQVLQDHLNSPFNWKYSKEGLPVSWSILVGETAVWVLRTTVLPTLLKQKCLWCGLEYKGGPEFCCQIER